MAESESEIEKVFLEVPFEEIEYAKKLKLQWCPEEKKWAVHSDHKEFKSVVSKYKRINLSVEYEHKDEVKKNGGKWDAKTKQWYTYQSNKTLYQFMSH